MNAQISTNNLIATNNEHAFVGAIAMWHLYGDVELEELKRSWVNHGLDEKLLPSLPSPEVCLTRAVDEFSGGEVFKRRIKGGGYRLVREDRADEKIADYNTECSVKLDDSKKLVFELFSGVDISSELKESFVKHSKQLSARDMSPWLCNDMMRHLKATSLKSNGGVYFVPRDYVEELGRIKRAIEATAGHRLYMVKAMTDDEAIEMVIDAIMREAEAEAQAVEADLAVEDDEEAGTKALGARACETRADRCQDMIKKLRLFEEICGRSLEESKKRQEKLKVAAMGAALAARAKQKEEMSN